MSKKKIIIPAAVIGVAIGVFFGVYDSGSESTENNPKNVVQPQTNNTIEPIVSTASVTEIITPEKKYHDFKADLPELINNPNFSGEVESVELEIGVDRANTEAQFNEIVKNIIELVTAGYIQEAQQEAALTRKNTEEIKKITVEVPKSSVKTQ